MFTACFWRSPLSAEALKAGEVADGECRGWIFPDAGKKEQETGGRRCTMEMIVEGIKQAFFLIFTLDREVIGITLLSLKVSGSATLISMAPSASLSARPSRSPGSPGGNW